MDTSPKWIEKLFARLAVHYGSRWMRLWEGVDLDAVKASWVHGLEGVFERSPHAIAYALDNLPDDPPNVAQFRRICNARPADPLPALPDVPADPARVAAAVAALAKPPERTVSAARECAERLRGMLKDGRRLTPAQRAMLESCEQHLGSGTAPEPDMVFRPIPVDALPPGMRPQQRQRETEAA